MAMAATGLRAGEPEAPLVLDPSGPWQMHYADDSCRLARTFGEGDDASVFYIERYEPGDRFFMVVAGEPFAGREGFDVRYEFGPGGAVRESDARTGELGDYGPALMVSNMALMPLPDDREDYNVRKLSNPAEWAGDADIFGQVLTAAMEEAITWLEVRRKSRRAVRLALGSMKPAMAAMRACTDELLTHWGLDLAAHRTMSRPPVPASNPGTWINSSDYPRDMLSRGAQGMVQFRLTVGVDGRPTACHIQQSTRPVEFDEAVCRAVMRRAEFSPALDKDGSPMVTYWRSGVSFIIP